jgi:hypothetical protein
MCQLKSFVDAGEAKTAPPLGPLLAQFQLDMVKVCKELNELTKEYELGVPLPVKIEKIGLSYKILIGSPTFQFLYEQLITEKLDLLLFYDLVRLYSFYHKREITRSLVLELLASLSSMKVKWVIVEKEDTI